LQHTIDEVENLIKKHEAFEKSAAAQEERFAALERLTTVRGNYVQCFERYWIQMINKLVYIFVTKVARHCLTACGFGFILFSMRTS
jgi:hypothetical protein